MLIEALGAPAEITKKITSAMFRFLFHYSMQKNSH